ncbi:MAG TPA: hypothetical protein V6D18_11965 [Thermosynechococcaceae cyanobacterium]
MKIRSRLAVISGVMLLAFCASGARAEGFQHDYAFSSPLPQTGRLTIRRPLRALPANQLFARCPAASRLEEFAESTNFLVMVCRDNRNALQKFWIQKAKKTGKITRLTAQDKPQSQPSPWTSGDYSVSIYADGARPEKLNAYLESYNTRTKQGRAEALIYYYSKFNDRR